MTNLVTPIYIGTLNGKPLRFFRAPFAEPHLPWHVPDELHVCLGMPRDMRRHYQKMLQSSDWSKDVRTVATSEGIVTIGPHWMAQGLISSIIQFGRATTQTEFEYTFAAGEALKSLAGDLPPHAFINFTTSALYNTHGLKTAGSAS